MSALPRRTLARALTLVAMAATAPAAHAVEFQEFRVGGQPAGIARGADGNVWVADAAERGRILRVTPAGEVTAFTNGLTPDARPTGITPGPDGNVWFTLAGRSAIGRITRDGAITEFTAGISQGSEPQDIVAAPDGNLWFTQRNGRIGRITPSGAVTEFSSGMPAGARPQGITVGADGNVWFTDSSASAAIGQITRDGIITVYDAAIPAGSMPYDIAAGADGNLYFTLAGTHQVGRMTPGGDVKLFGGLRPKAMPLGMALAPDGRVWFAQRDGGRTTTIDVKGKVDEMPAHLNKAEAPSEVTPGPGGSVWITETGRGGSVGVYRGVGPADSTVGLPNTTPGLPGAKTIVSGGAHSVPAGDGPVPTTSGGQTAAAVEEAIEEVLGGDAGQVGEDYTLPVQGKDHLAAAVAGDIYVRGPKQRRSPPLRRKLKNIPNKSRVDSTRGVVILVSALPKKKFQMAVFKDGRFDVDQDDDGSGYVDLTLRGKTGCGGNGEPDEILAGPARALASASRAGRPVARASADRKPARRRLWASDKRGRFRTHGRDSVATVRGTEWITEDTCEGTLTTVVKGAVEVADKHTHEKALVKAGESYLARKR
jgi:virginiamycin B lyase